MKADRVLGAGFVVLGLGMVWSMSQLVHPSLGQGDPGPTILPTALGVVIALLGAILTLRVGTAGEAITRSDPEISEAAIIVPPEPVLFRVFHLVNLLAYVALFEIAGFSLSSFLFLAVAVFLLGARSLRGLLLAVMTAAVFTLVVGTTLAVVVGVPLPGVFLG